MTKGTLYGSLTSPYVRLCRIVRACSGAGSLTAFSQANAWDDAYRQVNPLGKVPALILDDGTACLETTLICRTLMDLGGTSLLPADTGDRIRAEADVALMMGILDLGVAHFLEARRPEAEQSESWQERRFNGLKSAAPAMDEAATRGLDQPNGYAAFAVGCTYDWLTFRHAETLDWATACPSAGKLLGVLKGSEDFTSTDPRNA